MIDITGNDIKDLNDTDLRTLVGLLCEAELSAARIPTVGVTWGGHQNAKDGGIDVRVEFKTNLHKDSFIPRAITGFQVKKPDMPRNSILNEMRPSGEIRQVIKELADDGGAYIIVSSQGSTSDSALRNRKKAMREALNDYVYSSSLKVDFYDRERIAAWVRSHPSLILWVRDKIGRPFHGWKTYSNWAKSPGGIEEEYIVDTQMRICKNAGQKSNTFSVLEGINELRKILHNPGASVRLVGLSGVGKTRLIQSLFDERIGKDPLDKFQVFYCDIGDEPSPDARNFVERLIAINKPAIVVIDNCQPDLHRRLTSLCSETGSLVSLITVEYDIRDDQPEKTEVFRLEPASPEVVEKIILSRFSYISKVDAHTIGKFSGGNARIAIALANTIQPYENLSNLRDEELFNRLFNQRNIQNSTLLRTAEVCSLVYSFDYKNIESDDSELKLLGSLYELSVREVYENVSELKRRDLVQQRSIWRAVLPHAIANRLAKRALENIPLNYIYSVFERNGSDRLLKSFSRRLSYLHESDTAIEISKRWLSEDGLLGDFTELNELGIHIFKNISPINPELTLTAIERVLTHKDAKSFFSRENRYYNEFTRVLRSLAYDKELFERATKLICMFALSEAPKENYNSIRRLLKSLFQLYLSGTNATPDQRLSIISSLIESENYNEIELGISLLSSSLEAWNFISYDSFEFGARSRDYGFKPGSKEEKSNWFKIFIRYSITLAISDLQIASKIRGLLADKFKGLCLIDGMLDEFEYVANEISNKCCWQEGWIAVKGIKKFHSNDMKPENLRRLDFIDNLLRPKTLIDRAKICILNSSLAIYDYFNDENEIVSDSHTGIEEMVHSLGCEVGKNNEVFKKLLPDILSNQNSMLFYFGQGLFDGSTDHKRMWRDFCEQLSLIEVTNRSYQVLSGFLNAMYKVDWNLFEVLLDQAVYDKVLAPIYPRLQTCVAINKQGVERLERSIEYGVATMQQYENLAYGRAHESISDEDFCRLLKLIYPKDGGMEVSIKILQMRLFSYKDEGVVSEKIVSLGKQLLSNYKSKHNVNRHDSIDYELASIIRSCLIDESAADSARILCKEVLRNYEDYNSCNMEYSIVALATTQPVAFLDTFLGEDRMNDSSITRILWRNTIEQIDYIDHIEDSIVINWCEIDPEVRYSKVASAIIPFQKSEKTNSVQWTPLALKIIDKSDNPNDVLNKFKLMLAPQSWSGSRADIMQSRLCLIIELKRHKYATVVEWACKEEKIFEREIRLQREWELKQESERDERFE